MERRPEHEETIIGCLMMEVCLVRHIRAHRVRMGVEKVAKQLISNSQLGPRRHELRQKFPACLRCSGWLQAAGPSEKGDT